MKITPDKTPYEFDYNPFARDHFIDVYRDMECVTWGKAEHWDTISYIHVSMDGRWLSDGGCEELIQYA